MNIDTQNYKIYRHIVILGKSLTPLQALSLYGCNRLASRIYDLRTYLRCRIEKKMIQVRCRGNRKATVARYSLETP